MNSRKVFVYQDVNYAASKTSATANTALTPDQLADGSVAVYGIQEGGSTNVNKLVLLTDGGSEAAGKCPASGFTGKEVFIAMGTPTGVQIGNPIGVSSAGVLGLRRAYGTKYVAPVRGVLRFGYNGTAGTSFNLPATINRGDDFVVIVFNRNYFVSGGQEPGQRVTLSAQALQGDSQYKLVSRWITAVNNRTDDILIDKTKIRVLTGATGSAFTNSATVALTNGSTAVTTSAAHGVTVGQWITLNGDLYQAAAVPSSTTITLDRPWQQATIAALANNLTVNTASTTEPTTIGIEVVDNKDFYNIEGGLNGIANAGTILRQTLPSPGEGSYIGILNYEKEALPKKGSENLTDATIPHDIYRANPNLTYDVYFLTVRNSGQPTGQQGGVFDVLMFTILAFVSGVADTAGKNQCDWENIMTSLFTTFPQISA